MTFSPPVYIKHNNLCKRYCNKMSQTERNWWKQAFNMHGVAFINRSTPNIYNRFILLYLGVSKTNINDRSWGSDTRLVPRSLVLVVGDDANGLLWIWAKFDLCVADTQHQTSSTSSPVTFVVLLMFWLLTGCQLKSLWLVRTWSIVSAVTRLFACV